MEGHVDDLHPEDEQRLAAWGMARIRARYSRPACCAELRAAAAALLAALPAQPGTTTEAWAQRVRELIE